MKKLKIYHNQSCSKSRETLKMIQESPAEVEVIHYLEKTPTVSELDSLLTLLGLEPEQIVRKGEDRYEELELHINPPKSRMDWLQVLVNNPILIERPIVSDGKRAVIGRPPENVRVFLR